MASYYSYGKKPNITWTVKVYLGKDENGVKKTKKISGFGSKPIAEAWAKKHEAELQEEFKKQKEEAVKITVQKYLDKWVSQKRNMVKPSTIRQYVWLVNLLKEELSQTFAELTPKKIQNIYERLLKREKPLKPQSIVHLHHLLHNFCEEAVEEGYMPKNIMDQVKRPRIPKEEMKFWSVEEMTKFLNAAKGHRYYMVYLLLLGTGMRIGECSALTWRDINWAKKTISITKTYSHAEKGMNLTDVKTASSKRNITISDNILEALGEHRKKQKHNIEIILGESWNVDHLINQTITENYYLPSNIRSEMYKICKKAGVRRIRLHDFRHTYISLLYQIGTPVLVIATLTGHSDPAMIMKRYAHIEKLKLQEEAAVMINDYFSLDSSGEK